MRVTVTPRSSSRPQSAARPQSAPIGTRDAAADLVPSKHAPLAPHPDRSHLMQACAQAHDDHTRLRVLRAVLAAGVGEWWSLPCLLASRCSARLWEDDTLVRFAFELERARSATSSVEATTVMEQALRPQPVLAAVVALIAADSNDALAAARRCTGAERRQISRIMLSSVSNDEGRPAAELPLNLGLWFAVLRKAGTEAPPNSMRVPSGMRALELARAQHGLKSPVSPRPAPRLPPRPPASTKAKTHAPPQQAETTSIRWAQQRRPFSAPAPTSSEPRPASPASTVAGECSSATATAAGAPPLLVSPSPPSGPQAGPQIMRVDMPHARPMSAGRPPWVRPHHTSPRAAAISTPSPHKGSRRPGSASGVVRVTNTTNGSNVGGFGAGTACGDGSCGGDGSGGDGSSESAAHHVVAATTAQLSPRPSNSIEPMAALIPRVSISHKATDQMSHKFWSLHSKSTGTREGQLQHRVPPASPRSAKIENYRIVSTSSERNGKPGAEPRFRFWESSQPAPTSPRDHLGRQLPR